MQDDLHEMSWKGSPDDAWILANWHPRHIRALYCDKSFWGKNALDWESVRQYRKRNKKFLDRFRGMEKPTPHQNLDSERERVRKVRNVAPKVGQTAAEHTVISVPVEHLEYHQKLQEALDSEGRLDKATFTAGEHTGFIKNSDNEIEYTEPLKSQRLKFEVSFDTEPKWPPVNRVESVKIPKKELSEKDRLRTSKRAVILSDLQIPFADEKAVEVALEALRDYKPDKIVLVGDLLDLSAWSKYIQRPEWATATQDAVNQAHLLLQRIRKLAPAADIAVLEGNHDARMEKYALNNAQAAFGLRRADQPEGWPVLSVPYLTAMDSLDIEYISGYPANRYWINQNLQVRHGSIARKGNTAIAVAQEERISTIFGHIHRVETQFLTHHTYEGGKTIGAWSIGCLCDIMGKVPSVKGGVDLQGKPVPNAENWQQGFAVVDYEEDDGAFNVQPIYINTFNSYQAIVNGRKYGA
jgi:hypothetical protein